MFRRSLRTFINFHFPRVFACRRAAIASRFNNHQPLLLKALATSTATSAALLGFGSVKTTPSASLADLYEKCAPSVVHLRLEIKTVEELVGGEKTLISNGSGFVVTADGLILTNAHVVSDMSVKSKLKIKYFDGRVVKGTVVCLDPLSDLALVRPAEDIDVSKYAPLPLAPPSSGLRVGDVVFAIGSPFGLLNAMSKGIVSGLNRNCWEMNCLQNDSRLLFLQTDLHLFPGNSGGPIIDTQGRVVGIATIRSGGGEGLSFGIQVGSIERLLEQMLHSGRVRRAWLGFRGVSLNPEIVEQIDHLGRQSGLQGLKHGVLVLKTYPQSPASEADILPGDVVVAVNGHPVSDMSELLAQLDSAPIGQLTKLEIRRIILANGQAAKITALECFLQPDEYDVFSSSVPYN